MGRCSDWRTILYYFEHHAWVTATFVGVNDFRNVKIIYDLRLVLC
jgi:hypothetical protein